MAKKIAYTRSPAYSGGSPDSGLYILNAECIGEKSCERGYGPFPFMSAYAWSPDSIQLAGISRGELFIYEYKENELRVVHSLGEVGGVETMVWSPDGRYLAFGPVDEITCVCSKTYLYSLDDNQIEEVELPPGSRLRGWVRFP